MSVKKCNNLYSLNMLMGLKKARVLTAFIKNANIKHERITSVLVAFMWSESKELHSFWNNIHNNIGYNTSETVFVTIKEFRKSERIKRGF